MPSTSKPYLLTYNALSALLWLRILIPILSAPSTATVYTTLEPWTRWTQTLAAAEILHAALGALPPLLQPCN